MFDLWTQPAHVARWTPPTGFTMDFRRVEYLQVQPPDRIQYTQCFADEHENIARHPGAPTWPEKMLTTVLLAAEGPARTRVTVRWEAYGAATPEEVAAFVKEKGGMTKGWTGSFDKLDAQLPGSGEATHAPWHSPHRPSPLCRVRAPRV